MSSDSSAAVDSKQFSGYAPVVEVPASSGEINGDTAPPSSCWGRFVSVMKKPWNALHSLGSSAALSIASTVGAIVSAIIPEPKIAIASASLLGYFGQSLASKCAKKVSSPYGKKVVSALSRTQQHASLPIMMLTGYFQATSTAQSINWMMAGMFLRMKIQNSGKKLLAPHTVKPLLAENPQGDEPVLNCTARIQKLFKTHWRKIAFTAASAALLTSGLASMYALNQFAAPRAFTLSICLAEYGFKGIGAMVGYALERWLDSDRKSEGKRSMHTLISMTEGIGTGLSLFGHQVLTSNIHAACLSLPLGFFVGIGHSRMMSLYTACEQQNTLIVASEPANESVTTLLQRAWQSSVESPAPSTIIIPNFFSTLFPVFGLILLFRPQSQTVGLPQFFILSPLFYWMTRYLFSASNAKKFQVCKFGHLLLQMSPAIITEELNWSLTFLRARAIAPTEQNAEVFFAFQALLFGSIEGTLWTLDEKKDVIEQSGVARPMMLDIIRDAQTRSFTRLDMISATLAGSFVKH